MGVMAALEAAIQETSCNFNAIWMAGSSPAMTIEGEIDFLERSFPRKPSGTKVFHGRLDPRIKSEDMGGHPEKNTTNSRESGWPGQAGSSPAMTIGGEIKGTMVAIPYSDLYLWRERMTTETLDRVNAETAASALLV